QLVSQVLENTHSVGECDSDHTKEITEPHLSFSFKIETDANGFDARRQSLDVIVAERNQLIHHLLPHIKPTCPDSWSSVERLLDQQRDKIMPELNTLRSMIESLQGAKKELAEFLSSDEGVRRFELIWLQQSPIVRLLVEIATSESPGWASMSAAGQQIRRTMHEEMAALKERYGHKTLKALMLASELFELTEEQTPKGGRRVLYKLTNT